MKTLLTICLITGILTLAGAGCGSSSAKSCQDACNKIYDQCQLTLVGQTKGQCVSGCNAMTTGKQQAIDCVMNAACNESALQACIPMS